MIRKAYIRTKNWWRPKMGFLLAVLCFYLAAEQPNWQQGLFLLLLSIVAVLGIGSVGHVLNDWSDITEDKRVGKSNTMAPLPVALRFLVFLAVLIIGYLPWFVGFKVTSLIVALLILETVLFTIYSVKPIRLKRFPKVAIVLDALYAYVNPSLFLWLTFVATLGMELRPMPLLFLVVWTLPMGLRHILNHHVQDRENDCLSSTPNLANLYSPAAILKWMRYVLVPIELIGALLFMATIGWSHYWLCVWMGLAWLAAILFNYSAQFPFVTIRLGTVWMDEFYLKIVTAISLLVLTAFQLQYGIALLFFVLFFTDLLAHPLVEIGMQRLQKALLYMLKKPFALASLAFNWKLYYFRKWVLGWSEERNWGEHYKTRLEQKRLDAKGNVAIFNQNYTKFSETFIAAQRQALDYRTYFYYGHPKPLMEQSVGHLMDANAYMRQLKYACLRLINKDIDAYENALIANSLIKNKVSVIVAHFGHMAVAAMPAAAQSGIPLIAVFHGYDAWNKGELSTLKPSYAQLFKTAACVVGVSKDICTQLQTLGCDPGKIVYLPAQMGTIYLQPTTRVYAETAPTFLSVGRFSKTKAPFLVLSAFKQVVAQMPTAKLVMVGTDDGEDLFEACKMMAQAWNLADKVTFLGAVAAADVYQQMLDATIFIQHSVTTPLAGDKEGTPVAIMEAMAMGLPIVATQHAGIEELLVHQETALLVAEYDLHNMATEMLRFANNVELRAQIGRAAANAAQHNIYIRDNLKRFSQLIDLHKLKR